MSGPFYRVVFLWIHAPGIYWVPTLVNDGHIPRQGLRLINIFKALLGLLWHQEAKTKSTVSPYLTVFGKRQHDFAFPREECCLRAQERIQPGEPAHLSAPSLWSEWFRGRPATLALRTGFGEPEKQATCPLMCLDTAMIQRSLSGVPVRSAGNVRRKKPAFLRSLLSKAGPRLDTSSL